MSSDAVVIVSVRSGCPPPRIRMRQCNRPRWTLGRRRGRLSKTSGGRRLPKWVKTGSHAEQSGLPLLPQQRTFASAAVTSAKCRYCCKTLFGPLKTNFPGCGRGDRIIVWGTTANRDELTGNFGGALEDTSTGDYRLVALFAEKSLKVIFGVLQHNLPGIDLCTAARVSA